MNRRDAEDDILAELEEIGWEITAEYPTAQALCEYLRGLEPRFTGRMEAPRELEAPAHRAA